MINYRLKKKLTTKQILQVLNEHPKGIKQLDVYHEARLLFGYPFRSASSKISDLIDRNIIEEVWLNDHCRKLRITSKGKQQLTKKR